MTENACVLCMTSDFEVIPAKDAKAGGVLSVRRCSRCGLVQQNPLPSTDELEIYYSHSYRQDYKSVYQPAPRYVYRAGLTAKDRLHWMGQTILPSDGQRLLDIGAGGGEFVYCARRMGYDSQGIEPNIGYSEFARSNYEVEIQTGMLADLETKLYDVITLFHVLEHMAEPRQVVEKLHTLLSDEGFLAVEVPNILQIDASPSNIFFKAHLIYYSPATICALFSSHFEVAQISCAGNLKVIFQKKEFVTPISLPDAETVMTEKLSYRNKSWLTYLFNGGGWKKLFQNNLRRVRESQIRHLKPRDILDKIMTTY